MLKKILGGAPAFIYFVSVMWWVLLMLVIVPLMSFSEICTVRTTGFAGQNMGYTFIGILGLFAGLSLLIRPFRKMYYVFPWMFPLVKIFFINVVIMGIATVIINYGYEIQDNSRHTLFFILMLAEIIIGRLVMCLYFNRKKVMYVGGAFDEK